MTHGGSVPSATKFCCFPVESLFEHLEPAYPGPPHLTFVTSDLQRLPLEIPHPDMCFSTEARRLRT
jgi:hypothetical protein